MRTHPLNVSYLVVGLVFLGISGCWALRAADVVDLGEVQWLIPTILVGAGVIGLLASAARGLSGHRSSAPTTYDEPDLFDQTDDPYKTDDTTDDTTDDDDEGGLR